jgi:hypothetical protein
MTRYLKLFVCLTAAFAAAASAQTTDPSERAEAARPVAFVYVARALHIDAFAAASDGKLTRVPGSPFLNPTSLGAITSMSVNKKYLFGGGVYTFSIGSNGALRKVSEINAANYPDDCGASGLQPLQIDYTGSTLYNQSCQSFKIENNGELQFLGAADNGIPNGPIDTSQLIFLGTNKYAYQMGCIDATAVPTILQYQRESNGLLTLLRSFTEAPATGNPDDVYCPFYLAGDPANHLASANREYDTVSGQYVGPWVLATYTADSQGNLTTNSSYENMPQISSAPNAMSISPTAKLLAVGGGGFQVFHFNGGEQVTPYTGVIQPGLTFTQFCWDNHNHLYALDVLDNAKLYVYTVTPTSIVEAPGSPYSVPEGVNIIVRSLE